MGSPAPGYKVDAEEVAGSREPDDTAFVRLTIDASRGCRLLEQRLIGFEPGRSRPRGSEERQEVLYVAAGRGHLRLNGTSYELEPDMGVFIAAGERYEVENPDAAELVLVSVTAPQDHPSPEDNGRRAVRYDDQPSLPASPNREFRYLVDHEVGCLDVTQFVGVIPPGRAPLHSHTYDEVLYVVEGRGVLHIGDLHEPISAGSCVHLPPLVEHCLENTGKDSMRVLGVFHPAGDPASRAPNA